MSKLSDTPAISLVKSDAKALLQSLKAGSQPAWEHLNRSGVTLKEKPTLAVCQRAVAHDYGYDTFEEVQKSEELVSRYIAHCYCRGYWSKPFVGEFRRARHELQCGALIECFRDQIPLALAAEKRNIDFTGFHFSEPLINHLHIKLGRLKVPDFSNLIAPGALIHSLWLLDVTHFRSVNFRNVKIYSMTIDPIASPGATCFKADFSNADLRGADLRGTYFRNSSFHNALLDGADLRNANTFECSFTGSKGSYLAGNVSRTSWLVA